MTIELDTTLAQAEVLFLSFAQLVADIDRRAAEEPATQAKELRKRNKDVNAGSSPSQTSTTPNVKTSVVSEELRELLKAGR